MVNFVYGGIGFAVALTIARYLPIRKNYKVIVAVLIIVGFMLGVRGGIFET